MTTTAVQHVALTTDRFEAALVRYVDEAKPDPLAKKQVEGWTCEWTQGDDATSSDDGYQISGTFALHGDYMTVLLRVDSHWTWKDNRGALELEIYVRARFRTKSELKNTAAKDNKVDKKVRAGMLKRLRQDDYIAKLLEEGFSSLCQASVSAKDIEELEERVWIDQDLLEAVRRSIYSQADNVLSVVELVTAMPYCSTPDCPLGHRAKLRLLEDAMLDACDREGEEELVDELSLGQDKDEDTDDDGDSCQQVQKKKRR